MCCRYRARTAIDLNFFCSWRSYGKSCQGGDLKRWTLSCRCDCILLCRCLATPTILGRFWNLTLWLLSFVVNAKIVSANHIDLCRSPGRQVRPNTKICSELLIEWFDGLIEFCFKTLHADAFRRFQSQVHGHRRYFTMYIWSILHSEWTTTCRWQCH